MGGQGEGENDDDGMNMQEEETWIPLSYLRPYTEEQEAEEWTIRISCNDFRFGETNVWVRRSIELYQHG